MASTNELESRLDAELAAVSGKVEELRAKAVQAHEKRQERYAEFLKVGAEMSEKVGKPRLEALMKRFPEATSSKLELKHGRGVHLNFNSDLARVDMEIAAHLIDDSDGVLVTYDLSILPIFIEFEQHSEIRQPLSKVDHDAVGKWLDDRLVAFAKTYYAIQFTEQYQRRYLAVDPVAAMRFPVSFAAGSVEHDGVTYHFLSEQTKSEFERNPGAFVPTASKTRK